MLTFILIGIIYIIGVIGNSGFSLADLQARFPPKNYYDYRNHLAFSIGWSLFPVSWIVCPFLTGFYQYGWTLLPRPKMRGKLNGK